MHICKSYEIKQISEKRKRQKNKKIRSRGEPFGPAEEEARGPTMARPESVPKLLSSTTNVWARPSDTLSSL
jgi:hypothetical protein